MATSLRTCATHLDREGVRHHLDGEEATIRVVLVTQHYRNLRGEKLLIVRIETPDDGHRCRVSVPRAFAGGADPAATVATLCRLAADTPFVGVEHDADAEDVRLVAEMPVEDARLTRLQLLTLVDRVAAAAEAWSVSLAQPAGVRPRSSRRSRGVA